MKIGIYSDLHCSKSSSILSSSAGSKYSQRLDLIVKTFEWMYDLFDREKVDFIVNNGDTFDSDIILASENAALAEALSKSKGLKEYHLLGNHEKSSKSSRVHSVALLDNYDNIEVVTSPKALPEYNIALLPYTSDYENLEIFSQLHDQGADYLFTHADYIGMKYDTGKESEYGFSPQVALDYFKIIFNGHIHSASSNHNNRLINIGSVLGSGFGNSYRESYPSVIIFDTETGQYTRYVNPHSPLFFKHSSRTLSDLITWMQQLDTSHMYCIKVEVPYTMREDARNVIDKYISQNPGVVLASRVQGIVETSANLLECRDVVEAINNFDSGVDALCKYIEVADDLPFPAKDILSFVEKYFK